MKFVEIKRIDTREVTNETVYDIQLSENHYFSANNIITHNCRLKNKLTTKEFNFTNGNIGLQTGSKSVITLNLSRIAQDWALTQEIEDKIESNDWGTTEMTDRLDCFCSYLGDILERVYKYHTAYDSILRDMESAHLLPVYSAGFINLNKQYLTIGINGLNEMAEFLGIECHDSWKYSTLCQKVFGYIKSKNTEHKTKETMFNTECVPAESLAIKNYNWDKADGYWVPEDRNLYASYIFVPSDKSLSILDKIHLHGKDYIGDYLDGGSAAHLNLAEHLSKEQYSKILEIAAQEGCQYFTFNVPNSECSECHYITKHPISKCPKCGSEKIWSYCRVIGYLTKIQNWSEGRRIEQKTRVYLDHNHLGI
jgi:ribonucleoside-triphosphate reductase